MRILSFLSSWLVLLTFTPNSSTCQASASPASSALASLKDIDYRYFVAGGTCAAISHGITTPIDVVKTRIQADPKKYDKGMLAATVDILQTDGPGALLGGLGPTVVGYGLEGAMKFGVYEVAKPIFAKLMADNTKVAYLGASILAGAVAALLLCPMESLRIKQVTDPAYADTSLITGSLKLIGTEGIASLFGGVVAMLSKQVPYTFGKQVSFDVVAGAMYQALAEVVIEHKKWLVSIGAAFCASLVACLLSQPGDMILTETYRGATPQPFGVTLNKIHSAGGVSEFFRGTKARIVHVGMIITSQLVIYDIVKQMLGLPATGSH